MPRYIVVIEGPNLSDVDEQELLMLPHAGDPIETKLGTCVVVTAEESADGGVYAGRITCEFPGM